MDTADLQPTCGFCEGTGLWADDGGEAADPCPLCDGTGVTPCAAVEDAEAAEGGAYGRLLALLPQLTPAERQRLYEELYARYDCRIYRP